MKTITINDAAGVRHFINVDTISYISEYLTGTNITLTNGHTLKTNMKYSEITQRLL